MIVYVGQVRQLVGQFLAGGWNDEADTHYCNLSHQHVLFLLSRNILVWGIILVVYCVRAAY